MLKTLMLENSYNTPHGPESERESLDWAHTWKSKWVLPSSHAVRVMISLALLSEIFLYSLFIALKHAFCSTSFSFLLIELFNIKNQSKSALQKPCQTTHLMKSVRSEQLFQQWTWTSSRVCPVLCSYTSSSILSHTILQLLCDYAKLKIIWQQQKIVQWLNL